MMKMHKEQNSDIPIYDFDSNIVITFSSQKCHFLHFHHKIMIILHKCCNSMFITLFSPQLPLCGGQAPGKNKQQHDFRTNM